MRCSRLLAAALAVTASGAACGEVGGPRELASDELLLDSPFVLAALPDGEGQVAPDVVVRLRFSVAMEPGAASAFELTGMDGGVVGGVAWDSTASVLAFRPEVPLAPGFYLAKVAEAARSAEGVGLAEAFEHAFEVASAFEPKQ